MNITRSAYACFSFTRNFFESYHVDTTVAAIQQDSQGPFLRCKVLARALVSACKIRGNIAEKTEKLNLVLDAAEGLGENCRLAIDIIFKHGNGRGQKNNKKRNCCRVASLLMLTSFGSSFLGFIKIHKLLYEACPENLGVVSTKGQSRNSWRIPAVALNGLPDNFSSKVEEITLRCLQTGLEFKTNQETVVDGDASKKSRKRKQKEENPKRNCVYIYTPRAQHDVH